MSSLRVEGIDAVSAATLAAQVYYLDLKKLSGTQSTSALSQETGVRFLQEGGYRGIDIYEVVKALHLSRPENRLMVLNLLKRGDLMSVLYLLNQQQLINGLQFFDKDKLLNLVMRLPKPLLIKMLSHIYSIEDMASKMPTSELFNILRSDKLPNRELIKGFQKMDMRYLIQLMGKIFDKDMSGLKQSEMLDILYKTPKRQLIEGMKFLPFRALTPMVTQFLKDQPELLLLMSPTFIMKLFSSMSKPTMMETFQEVPNDIIIEKFLSQLPDQMLLQVAAQVDPSDLEQYLLSSQPQLLTMLAAQVA